MDVIQLIVESTVDEAQERLIEQYGRVKQKFPSFGMYVVEVAKDDLEKLKGISGVRQVHSNAHITAQMNSARKVIAAEQIYQQNITGRGVTIAILDTGIAPVADFVTPRNRILAFVDFVNGKSEPYDDNAHGTHVAGIAAGNGVHSNGRYAGIAPESNIVSIKILDENGKGNAANVLSGIQWIIDNKERYNIRVANLSIGTEDEGSNDPLVLAVNAAWDAGIVMVIAAGNNGPDFRTVTSPGISRKVITVGASDDHLQTNVWGNSLVNFSGRGPTSECVVKPDLVAPGNNIVSCLSSSTQIKRERLQELDITPDGYVKMSGTSMSSPMVAGAAALMIEKNPSLMPDHVKWLLKKSANDLRHDKNYQGWGLVNVEKFLSQEVPNVGGKQNL